MPITASASVSTDKLIYIPIVAMVSHCVEPGRYLWNNVFLGQQTIYPLSHLKVCQLSG